MPAKTVQNQAASPSEAGKTFEGLFFEMDNVALSGRRARYEVLKSILAERRITLEPVMFSRYCLHSSPAHFMGNFLKNMNYTGATAEEVIERLYREVADLLMRGPAPVNPGLVKFMDKAVSMGADIGGISMLPPASAEAISEKLNLNKWNVKLVVFQQVEKNFPSADNWLKLGKTLNKNPRRCLAITSSMASSKSALAAGLKCIAVPDEFTAFQDFSGVNQVAENLADVNPDEFFKQVHFG